MECTTPPPTPCESRAVGAARHAARLVAGQPVEAHGEFNRLRSRGIETLLITGTLTNVCCESTARDAMMLDYRIIMWLTATPP